MVKNVQNFVYVVIECPLISDIVATPSKIVLKPINRMMEHVILLFFEQEKKTKIQFVLFSKSSGPLHGASKVLEFKVFLAPSGNCFHYCV